MVPCKHPLWFHSPFYWLLTAIGLAWGLSEWGQSYFSRDFGKGADNQYSTAAIYFGILLLYFIGASSLFTPQFLNFGSAALPLFFLGMASQVAGFTLRWTSIWLMGDTFSRKIRAGKSQKIVKSGPFAYIRHPNYLAGILMFLGFGLMFGTWVTLAACLLTALLVYGYRIGVEEKFLRKNLSGYARYCNEVAYRLIPFIY